jgi:antitoxin HigA-1
MNSCGRWVFRKMRWPEAARASAALNEIVPGHRGISADTALRLGRCFRTTAEFWIGLQSDCELRLARRVAQQRIEREVEPLQKAA